MSLSYALTKEHMLSLYASYRYLDLILEWSSRRKLV
jgi:hypothetical protein